MTNPTLVTIASGDGSRVDQPRRTIVRSEADWRALWAAHAGSGETAPAVDFAARMVAAVFAGERPTPGYDVEIVDSRRDGARLALVVEQRRPEPGAILPQIIAAPFHIVSCPRYDGDVVFVDAGAPPARASAAAPGPAAPATPATSSTGLDPTVAAALAYLVGPLSGAVILLAERSNRYVRFHAWQSILGLGGLWAIGFAFYVLAFLALFVSASAFKVMLWLAGVTWAVWVIVWALCLVKALTGATWKLPLAGDFADRHA